MKTRLFAFSFAALLSAGCAQTPRVSDSSSASPALAGSIERRHPAASRLAVLPDQSDWQSLYDYADNLDLTSPSIALKLSSGGTSVYAVILENGKATGAIIPPNESSSVSGETFAWTLSRALGVSQIYQPGVYKLLNGTNLSAFMAVVPSTPMKGSIREANRQNLLRLVQNRPGGIDAVYKRWDAKPVDYDQAVTGARLSPTHVLPGSARPLASLIDCSADQPSPYTVVKFNGGENSEYEIARQLSSILLIDALTQEGDRFTGGNLQTVTRSGQVSFVAFDNGGKWSGSRWTDRNLESVTRFDRNVAARILAMDDFFQRKIPFLGLRTEAEFVSAFDIVQAPADFKKFKGALKTVAKHLRAHNGCYF